MNLNKEIIGTGTPIVFLHGMGSSSNVWENIIKSFKNNKCILIDFPGHGKTPFNEWDPLSPEDMARQIIKAIDECEVTDFHLVGHSLGGWVGLEICSAYPDRVKSFTAISPAGLWRHKNTYSYPPTYILKPMHIILPLISRVIPRFDKLKKIAFSSAVFDYKKIDNLTATNAIKSFSIACNSWYKSKKIDNFKIQADILSDGFNKHIDSTIPITVIFGRRDMSFTRPKYQDRSLLPEGSKWLSWPDSGHVPMWDNTEKVIHEIKLNVLWPK